MSGRSDLAARLRGGLDWFLPGTLDPVLPWHRPRRALGPTLVGWGVVALRVLHQPLGYGPTCLYPAECDGGPDGLLSMGPDELVGGLALHVVAAALVYVLAVGTTVLVERVVDLERVAPWLFAPEDDALTAVGVVAFAALLAYLAGAYRLAYTVAVYTLWFPPLWAVTSPQVIGPLPTVVGVGAAIATPITETLWLYALGTAAARAARTDG